jgi:anthranilate phosphoribosyltransferase
MDELNPCGDNLIVEVTPEEIQTTTLRAEDFGLPTCSQEHLVGGTPQENAEIARKILEGTPGPRTDTVVMNAALALVAAGAAADPREGSARARDLLASGAARKKLDQWAAFTKTL